MDRRLSARAGFTLIELLVVVAVLSVVALGAGLTLARAPGTEPDRAALLRAFDDARRAAVTGQVWHGLSLARREMVPMRLNPDYGWVPSGPAQAWRGQASVRTPDPAAPGGPQIVFAPTAETSRVEIVLRRRGAGTVICRADGWSGLSCD
ncbi:prepilin-type N-terminal cleavage/methylation domain-containing protein [Roseivivax sediminis]|uniref:Prepilin-type N-terminal cleavage/methylation domain-containing protein n=1 Tax=Roseivivax sediminis TaxID=936889 RepID=A0A1I2AAX5_9RHOB|nr:prepilin-type N-terminal cleavage/methylation domain-containing protein [Roseivivax sediminis]SFE41165.1 prepilin-type N-terminal cleavage/methylation domain-containing protein [Roseivivax sediminis]